VKRWPPILIAVVIGSVLATALTETFGWIGTLLLNLPGIFLANAVKGQRDAQLLAVIFLGDFVFYTVLTWGVLKLVRRARAGAEHN
jgi:hypothetical protein